LRLDCKFGQRYHCVPAHRAVAFVVKEKHIEIRIKRWGYNSTVHVGVTSWLPHQTGSDVIVMFSKIAAFLENSSAFDGWQTINDHTKRLAASVHVNRGDFQPVGWRSPIHHSQSNY
jgi:hypothetical protein